MNRLSSFLHSKSILQANANHWRTDVVSGIGIFLFLYLLQPFGISQYQGNTLLMCLGFGAMTVCVQWLCTALFFGRTSKRKRQITNGYSLLHSIVTELAMAVSMTIYAAFFFGEPLSWALFGLFFYWTFLIWLLVMGLSVLLSKNRILNNRLEEMIKKTTDEQAGVMITLHDQNLRGVDLTLPINDLLYIESRKNNVSVCYIKEGRVEKTELRSTLSALKSGLPYENIFQCHRSFLVNINNIIFCHYKKNKKIKDKNRGWTLLGGLCHLTDNLCHIPKNNLFYIRSGRCKIPGKYCLSDNNRHAPYQAFLYEHTYVAP